MAVRDGRRTARVRTELRGTLLLSETEALSEEPTMSPLIMIDLVRAINDDRRRESRIAIVRRRMRSASASR
jgi:hypothetical protein